MVIPVTTSKKASWYFFWELWRVFFDLKYVEASLVFLNCWFFDGIRSGPWNGPRRGHRKKSKHNLVCEITAEGFAAWLDLVNHCHDGQSYEPKWWVVTDPTNNNHKNVFVYSVLYVFSFIGKRVLHSSEYYSTHDIFLCVFFSSQRQAVIFQWTLIFRYYWVNSC